MRWYGIVSSNRRLPRAVAQRYSVYGGACALKFSRAIYCLSSVDRGTQCLAGLFAYKPITIHLLLLSSRPGALKVGMPHHAWKLELKRNRSSYCYYSWECIPGKMRYAPALSPHTPPHCTAAPLVTPCHGLAVYVSNDQMK